MVSRQDFLLTRMFRLLNEMPQPRDERVDEVLADLLDLRSDWRAVLQVASRPSIRGRQ